MTPPAVGSLALAALLGYALGAVPSGVLATRLCGAPDVRRVGSGHTGGTNVVRATGRVWAGAATAVLDIVLAAAAVVLAGAFWQGPWPAALAGAAAVVGHNWSAYIGLRGGVGLSSITGMLIAQGPLATLAALVCAVAIWISARRLLGHDARSTVVTIALVPLLLVLFGQPLPVVVSGILGALAIIARALEDWRRPYRRGEAFAQQFLRRKDAPRPPNERP